MKGFTGFPQKGRLIRLPVAFFSELLPAIDTLAELKVTLYCLWRLQQKEGQVPYLRRSEILADQVFMSGLGPREDDRRQALQDGLERAVARGTLLYVHVQGERWEEDLYFINTPRGQAAVEGIEKGEWTPRLDRTTPVDVVVERPNIYTLYEQNIGPLTPLIADSLHDLEQTYSREWIEEAIRIAVERNARKLSYVEGILKRWQAEGRGEMQQNDPRRFISGPYSDDIEY